MTDERPTSGHERRPEGRGGLTRGGHEPAVGAGDGEAHERATARPRVVEHGAHDELRLGCQPASQVARVRLDAGWVGQHRSQSRHRVSARRARGACRRDRRGRSGGHGVQDGRGGLHLRIIEEARRGSHWRLAGRGGHGPEVEGQLQAAALSRRPRRRSLSNPAGDGRGQHGLFRLGIGATAVGSLARQSVDQGTELVLAEEPYDLRAVVVAQPGALEVQDDGRQAVDRHQLAPEQHVVPVEPELVAQLVRSDLVEPREDALQRLEVDEQLGSRLVTHARDARDVVRRIALERLEVDHLPGVEAVAIVDARGVVDDGRLDAQSGRHEPGPLGDQLQHVEVAGDDDRLQVAQLGLPRERADEVVRLVAGQLVDGDAKGRQGLADDGELLPQVVRRRSACGLVGLVAVGPEGAADVEAAHDVVRLHVCEATQDDGPEAEGGVDELALAGGQRRLEQGEIGPVDEAVGIEEHEPFHCPAV